jgi:hypothetical protein
MADSRFTNEHPEWMRPKDCETKKNYPTRKLSEETAQKIAKVLHVMLNDKS